MGSLAFEGEDGRLDEHSNPDAFAQLLAGKHTGEHATHSVVDGENIQTIPHISQLEAIHSRHQAVDGLDSKEDAIQYLSRLTSLPLSDRIAITL